MKGFGRLRAYTGKDVYIDSVDEELAHNACKEFNDVRGGPLWLGARSKLSKQMWDALSEEEQAPWNNSAEEWNTVGVPPKIRFR